ncbi:MAG TPA: YebC/PmpR family DNA-binding transcriptional regulator [Planctomycetes bacterium]|nr:YebC/PmpR family DNA-binding transcriptional regulator [Planctomycetota bacterium]
MAGHSHSANIARRKGAVDAKRAKIFSKCAKAIMSAVRQGGADPAANLKLRYAIEKARAENMPKDNIERAIKRASGEGMGDLEELIYEGYAPGGIALMVTCLTDNRNRTAPDVKHMFEKRGGNLGAQGSVSFLFDFRSIFVVETGERSEDDMMEVALEAGADDVEVDGDVATIYAPATEFLSVKEALEAQDLSFLSAQTGYVPQTTVQVESKADAEKLFKLIELLENHDDVQDVYGNYEMPDEWIEELAG